jgi:hypothetical protein
VCDAGLVHPDDMPDITDLFTRMTGWTDGSPGSPSPDASVDDDFGEGATEPEVTEPSHGSLFGTDASHGFVQADQLGPAYEGGTFSADPPSAPLDYHDGPIEAPGGGAEPPPEAPIDVGDGPVTEAPEGVPGPVFGSYQPDLSPGYAPTDEGVDFDGLDLV